MGEIIAFIVLVAIAVWLIRRTDRRPEQRIPCPFCAEKILPEAKVCPFCRSSLPGK